MTVKCKVYCSHVGKTYNSYYKSFEHTAEFHAVTDGSEENKKFFKYTPNASFKLGILNDQHFEAGKEYYVTFDMADPEAPPR